MLGTCVCVGQAHFGGLSGWLAIWCAACGASVDPGDRVLVGCSSVFAELARARVGAVLIVPGVGALAFVQSLRQFSWLRPSEMPLTVPVSAPPVPLLAVVSLVALLSLLASVRLDAPSVQRPPVLPLLLLWLPLTWFCVAVGPCDLMLVISALLWVSHRVHTSDIFGMFAGGCFVVVGPGGSGWSNESRVSLLSILLHTFWS